MTPCLPPARLAMAALATALPLHAAAESYDFAVGPGGPELVYASEGAQRGKSGDIDAAIVLYATANPGTGTVVWTKHLLVANCERATAEVFPAGEPPPKRVDLAAFKPPTEPRMRRFVGALCDGELQGLPLPAKQRSTWVHYLESDRRVVLYAKGGLAAIDADHVAARVRMVELQEATLVDGRRIAGSDAVWVLDCVHKTGAVAYELPLARDTGKPLEDARIGEPAKWTQLKDIAVEKLSFRAPQPGSQQARFGDFACASVRRH